MRHAAQMNCSDVGYPYVPLTLTLAIRHVLRCVGFPMVKFMVPVLGRNDMACKSHSLLRRPAERCCSWALRNLLCATFEFEFEIALTLRTAAMETFLGGD